MNTPAPLLACHNLGLTVRGACLLQGVSLALQPGEKLGIVGPNGSGKSTLLKLLAGIASPTQGRVELEGRDLHRLSRRDVARTLAVVQQQADTSDRLRVHDAVALGRTPWLSPMAPWRPVDEQRVREALAAVSLENLSERLWHSLSGGERQRAHIARALAQQPRLLLLDEPTNHLDIRQQLALLRLINQLPVTTVIALHDLNQALTCDRLAVLDNGRLVALGVPAQVLTDECLADTFGVKGRWLQDLEDGTRALVFSPL
ncbi:MULTISPECIES: ABC transporter ATP-binding protein [Pseudomonas]|uniref:ABC transporter ATP-binding protein n=1 Tax=Pseudomonas quercus TaxID=2722792 RepID=A0ABX0Y885_9PSED|nr:MULTISPECIES: ABC transporter ATP-binding protein [Pseudomonas]MBF7140986.1 ABC transporter ATP-binding protein [Pseudomonas sp. LY10J]NJO99520.1 ABC transporter ATP-binding protein [Pseudomonas quercus]